MKAIKDWFSLILAISGVVSLFFFKSNPENQYYLFIIVILSIVLLIAVLDSFSASIRLMKAYIIDFFSKRNGASIISHRSIEISILDTEGKKTSVKEDTYFESIKVRKKYDTKLWFGGTIDHKSIYSANCNVTPITNGLELSYYSLPGKISDFFNRQLYYSVAFNITDGFGKTEEFWDIYFDSFVKSYVLTINLPKERIPERPVLYPLRKVKYEENGATKTRLEVMDTPYKTQPIFIEKNNKNQIVLKLFNPKRKDEFRLIWNW